MILNSRIFDFHPEAITELPEEVTHFRGYPADFDAGKDSDGLYPYTNKDKMMEWADFIISRGLKSVWTLYMTKDRTLESEMKLVKQLINYGVEITHFQMGGEFWLPKYAKNDQSKKGVVEQVTMDDYALMLDEWIPECEKQFPQVQIMLLGCSHQLDAEQVEDIIDYYTTTGKEVKSQEHYRALWNNATLKYLREKGKDKNWGLTAHYYAGAKPSKQKGEETVYTSINWDAFISQLRSDDPNVDIIIPESGWYISEHSEGQYDKQIEFYEKGKEAIGENGLMGLHVIQARSGNHRWFSGGGITAVGENFVNYFKRKDEPVLMYTVPNAKHEWVFWGKTSLHFSDGSVKKIITRFDYRPFGNEDAGLTLEELLDK